MSFYLKNNIFEIMRRQIFAMKTNESIKTIFYLKWRKFRIWDSWSENWTIFVRIFEGVILVLELKFLVSFCTLIIFNHLLTNHKKFEVWGSLYENWSLSARIFEGVRFVLELQFLVSFYILMIYKHLLTCDKNFQLKAHNMKIDLFLADFERVRLIQQPEFSVSFCIFPACSNVPTDYKKFEPEAYDMKTGLFSRYFFGLCRL